jgi:tellurite resistance protein
MKLGKQERYILKKFEELIQNDKQSMLSVLEETIRIYDENGSVEAIEYVKKVKEQLEKSENMFDN